MGPPRTTSQPIQESCSGCSHGSNSAYLALLNVYAQIQDLCSGYSQEHNSALGPPWAAAQPKQESCSGCSQGNKSASLALLNACAQIQESRSGCSQGKNSASLALLQATRSSWPETLQSSAQFETRSRPAQLKARSGLRPFAVQDSL